MIDPCLMLYLCRLVSPALTAAGDSATLSAGNLTTRGALNGALNGTLGMVEDNHGTECGTERGSECGSECDGH